MMFLFLLASAAVCTAADLWGNELRSPITRRGVKGRDGPGYGQGPLRINATQKHYLSPYTVEITVGSPPQVVYPAIDLFTNYLWLDPDCDKSISPEGCCANGHYNPNNSATAMSEDCGQGWSFHSPDGSAAGCNVVDDVNFAGVDLGYVQIGIANYSSGQSAGRLGLGFGCNDVGDLSVLDHLKKQGLISSRQFSIAFGGASGVESTHQDASVGMGEIIFSGIDTGKFAGELRKLDARPSSHGGSSYSVTLSSIGLSDPGNCQALRRPGISHHAVFDFSTVMSYLPADLMMKLTGLFPDGTYNSDREVYDVPCSHRTHDGSVDFYFDDLRIAVPLRDFILDADGTCYLGATRNKDVATGEAILGLSFLRGAYTVYDLDQEAIYMAQYENCGDNLVSWDPSDREQSGLCVSRPTALAVSCSSTSTSTTTSTSSTSTSQAVTTTTTPRLTSRPSTRSTRLPIPLTTSTSSRLATRSTTRRITSSSSTHSMRRSTSSSRRPSTSQLTSVHFTLATTSKPFTIKSLTHSTNHSRTTSSRAQQQQTSTTTPRRRTTTTSSRRRTITGTGSRPTRTTFPLSSGILLTTGRNNNNRTSAGTATIFGLPTGGISWSNATFTPGNRTPRTRSSRSTTTTPMEIEAEMMRPTNKGQQHTITTTVHVKVTVGLLTTTVFVPSCSSEEEGRMTRSRGKHTSTEKERGCKKTSVTEFRTRTITESKCTTAAHSTRGGRGGFFT